MKMVRKGRKMKTADLDNRSLSFKSAYERTWEENNNKYYRERERHLGF